jgi:hypothetical protein
MTKPFNAADYIVDEENPEPSMVTCRNGCPEGARGRHKFSCYWAGTWFYQGEEAKVMGESEDQMTVCVFAAHGQADPHFHMSRDELGKVLTRVRHPDVEVHLSTGHSGNTMAILGTVTGALRRAGYGRSADRLTSEVFDSASQHEALRAIQRTVEVT